MVQKEEFVVLFSLDISPLRHELRIISVMSIQWIEGNRLSSNVRSRRRRNQVIAWINFCFKYFPTHCGSFEEEEEEEKTQPIHFSLAILSFVILLILHSNFHANKIYLIVCKWCSLFLPAAHQKKLSKPLKTIQKRKHTPKCSGRQLKLHFEWDKLNISVVCVALGNICNV